MLTVLRWIALVPACLLAWVIAFLVGLRVLGVVEGFCPPELVVSGMCGASWYPAAERATICFGVGLSAFLVVLASAITAPSQKVAFAQLALAVGTIIAAVMAFSGDLYWELGAAVLSGTAALFMVKAWLHRQQTRVGDLA